MKKNEKKKEHKKQKKLFAWSIYQLDE